jgi:alpha-glucosidase
MPSAGPATIRGWLPSGAPRRRGGWGEERSAAPVVLAVEEGTLPDEAGSTHLVLRCSIEGGLDRNDARLRVAFALDPEEACFGCGHQTMFLDLVGQRVACVVSEHGIGRGHPGVTEVVEAVRPGAGGSPLATEAASAVCVTSSGRALFVEGDAPVVLDASQPGTLAVEAPGGTVAIRLLAAERPGELLRRVTALTGRHRPLPDWVHRGVLLGIQGGTARVLAALDRLEAAGVPIAGCFLQDWVGQRRTILGSQLWWDWDLDEAHYPDWDRLVARVHALGGRVVAYANPYCAMAPGHDRTFQEARAAGYLLRRPDGRLVTVENSDFEAAIMDLTNPEARAWLAERLATRFAALGISGFMADFGEAFPITDVAPASGEDPWSLHNAYPRLWAQVCLEAVGRLPHPEEAFVFHRSGFTTSPGQLMATWLGDQCCSWDPWDGLPSALCGMISAGFSGYSVVHADAGGFGSFPAFGDLPFPDAATPPTTATGSVTARPAATARAIVAPSVPAPAGDARRWWFARSRELLARWLELGALSPVFRTHEGLNPEANVQWDHDEGTLGQLRRCARIYQAWGEERRRLVAEP